MLVGEKIKSYRIQFGFSQEDLAEKLDTSRQTISSWENGKTYPSVMTIVSLSEIFQVSVEALIKEDVQSMKEMMENKSEKIKRNKDRDILNRMVAARFLAAFVGALTAFPVYKYYGWTYAIIPATLLIMSLVTTIPIEHYRRKYNLKKYQDIVAFFDEKYNY